MTNAPGDTRGSAPTRVLIAGGDELFRRGLRALLEQRSDMRVVGDSETLDDLVRVAGEATPDVAVIDEDTRAADVDGLIAALHECSPSTRCLLVSSRDTTDAVQDAFEQGAVGVIARNARVADLFIAIERLCSGDHYLHPSLGARMLRREAALKGLTAREREIARQLALGHTNREIAGQECVSPRSVETHRARIMTKLRVRSRAELVRWALDCRLIVAAGD